jgi:hypothetical protein
MLNDLTSVQISLVVILVTLAIYPVGLLTQWALWWVVRWACLQIWGLNAARNVDMAIHPNPK